ncbi:MAG: substrate-binding domain-containing protein [Dermatophilaceae bacterium]
MSGRVRHYAVAAILLLALATVGACSSSSSTSTTTSAAGGSAATGSAAQALDTAYKGVMGAPPTTPTKPKSGVNLWVVSCGESVPSCSTVTAAAMEAGQLVGWTVNKCDGQLNPAQWGACIRQAISAKANVIIPMGIDCPAVKAPIQEANAAGIKVVGGGGADCTAVGGEKLFASERLQLADTSIEKYWNLNGKLQADYLIGKTNGTAKVLLLTFTDPLWGPWITDGFKKELATCSGCSIVSNLEIANNDFNANTAASKFSTALLQNPSANAVSVPVGGWMLAGISQAIMSSGRFPASLTVVTGFGDASSMDLVRNKQGQNAVLGYATPWGAYGSVDTAIRLLNGEAPLVQGDGMLIIDADHTLPATGKDYEGPVDYRAAYKKLWGLS